MFVCMAGSRPLGVVNTMPTQSDERKSNEHGAEELVPRTGGAGDGAERMSVRPGQEYQ